MTGATPAYSRPWEYAIRTRQEQVRRSWLMAAEELDRQKTFECSMLSKRIRRMVADMPPIETERERTKRELMERFGRKKEKTAVSGQEMPKERTVDRVSRRKEREVER